uniref:Uncharacterized protein n=1 Tax=Siphoviridae sp. ctzpQ31 TaxID=2823613 RepID=A0A8S5L851_9CAUD|nr:MAG TPA: hypothetical protein [Siphoviridae sp. ctzpQ31]
MGILSSHQPSKSNSFHPFNTIILTFTTLCSSPNRLSNTHALSCGEDKKAVMIY